jgi:hypothetical protein
VRLDVGQLVYRGGSARVVERIRQLFVALLNALEDGQIALMVGFVGIRSDTVDLCKYALTKAIQRDGLKSTKKLPVRFADGEHNQSSWRVLGTFEPGSRLNEYENGKTILARMQGDDNTLDKLQHYRRIVCDVLTAVTDIPYSSPEITHEAVFDKVHDRFLVMSVGWKAPTDQLHFCLIHVDIINEKIWIQRDETKDGIACDLEEAGVPKSDIVLAFHSKGVHPYTGYAVA